MSLGIVIIEGMRQSIWMVDGGTQVGKGEKRKEMHLYLSCRCYHDRTEVRNEVGNKESR
jgi:hypothetical protein